MKASRRVVLPLTLGLVASCSSLETEIPEVTTVVVNSPNPGVIRSADGEFEVELQLGALSSESQITVSTDRSRAMTTWPMSQNLPRYVVHISPCNPARPEFVRVRHQIPEGLRWDGQLTLARSAGEEVEQTLPTALEDGWVRADGVIDCATAEADGPGVRFELATTVNRECSLAESLQCAPCAPCEAVDDACDQQTDWVCQASVCLAVEAGTTDGCSEVQLDGWQDSPGSGRVFILDTLAIAEQGRGFDVDGQCRGPGDCIDNALWQLGQLANDQVRQGLLGGETLLLVELAGIDEPFTGNDENLSLKFYQARDADDPFFPGNNFQIAQGGTTCCAFEIEPTSLSGIPPQAKSRTPTQIRRGVLSSLAPLDMQFLLTLGEAPHPEVRLSRALVTARVPGSVLRISDGLLGGALSINALGSIENIYCRGPNPLCPRQLPDSTLIDLIASILQPDIDLDGDGLERLDVGANGRVGRCLDGDGSLVPPLSPGDPAWMCTLNPRIADGYSIAFQFTAVTATITGIAD